MIGRAPFFLGVDGGELALMELPDEARAADPTLTEVSGDAGDRA